MAPLGSSASWGGGTRSVEDQGIRRDVLSEREGLFIHPGVWGPPTPQPELSEAFPTGKGCTRPTVYADVTCPRGPRPRAETLSEDLVQNRRGPSASSGVSARLPCGHLLQPRARVGLPWKKNWGTLHGDQLLDEDAKVSRKIRRRRRCSTDTVEGRVTCQNYR